MNWEILILASFVFVARLCDVTLATLRHVLVIRGRRNVAGTVALIESLVWVFAMSRVLDNLEQPIVAVAFAVGFAAGTLVGMTIEQRLKLGEQVVRVFTTEGDSLSVALRDGGYRVTKFSGAGRDGRVDLLFIQIPRRQAANVSGIARELDPECFCVIDDVCAIQQAK